LSIDKLLSLYIDAVGRVLLVAIPESEMTGYALSNLKNVPNISMIQKGPVCPGVNFFPWTASLVNLRL
jgi:hypothetical protein